MAEHHLLRNLVLFGRVLRGLGLDVNPGRMIDLAEALAHVRIGVRSDFYHAVRSLLVHDREDIPLFDQAFEMFWQKPLGEWKRIELGGRRIRRARPRPLVALPSEGRRPSGEPLPGDAEERPVIEVTRTYSALEALQSRDFSDLTEEEMMEVRRLISEMIWRLEERTSRRYRAGGRRHLDLRRTLRRSLRHGGEIFGLARRELRTKPRPLVVIADVSGSMERYTRLLLHFVYSLTQGLSQRVETFAFGTRLTRLSRHLKDRDVERALAGVSSAVTDWAGGTRIGECLKAFNFDWARRVLGGGAIVLLISDGWDRGDAELLSLEMARLHRSAYRLVWLNPLLGSPEYEPLTRGMRAALPHVDDFLPVHNLGSLEALARHLERLARRAPYRRGTARSGSVRRVT
ncbi:MAG TPA: VWA domain-containing protein [Vicinamibacteria bacterium]|nr:VWA domain-containing protein [Vicinamibacteria bacterium]